MTRRTVLQPIVGLLLGTHLLSCAKIDEPVTAGYMISTGSFGFAHRAEAAAVRAKTVMVAGNDNPAGEIVDFSNPNNPTSATPPAFLSQAGAPAGSTPPEFSACGGARTATVFFHPAAQYNQDVLFVTCPNSRQGSLTPAGGGFTQLEFYNYVPGAAQQIPGTTNVAVADFEFGQLRIQDRSASTTPAPDVVIPLSTPLERSCPFSLTITANIAYVVGREGVVGTSTANCNNWLGLWFVDLTTNQVIDFVPFGTMPRDVEIGSDNRVYVSDFAEDKVYVIDAVGRTVLRTIDAGDGPVGLALTADAGQLFVTNWNDNLVKVFNLANDAELDSQDSGGVQPVDVFLSGNTLIVLNFGDVATSTGASLQFFTIE